MPDTSMSLQSGKVKAQFKKKSLLACGVLGSLFYLVTDIIAGNIYPGYSFMAQTVSELFAIGAPTSQLVVILFSICSLLVFAFGFGIWILSGGNGKLRALSLMILGNAIDSLILWNFFPIHMRGIQPGFTDMMHSILAINPFVLVSVILGAIYFKNWFRFYSIATIFIMVACAIKSFSYVPIVIENGPTPWMGLTERISQYVHQVWLALLAVVLYVLK
jgi:hypothetical protein